MVGQQWEDEDAMEKKKRKKKERGSDGVNERHRADAMRGGRRRRGGRGKRMRERRGERGEERERVKEGAAKRMRE